MPRVIRRLNDGDAEACRALRLRALVESPESFGASYEDEVVLPIDFTMQRLRDSPDSESFTLGAFDPHLLAMAVFVRETRPKTRHKGAIYAMYVAPEFRGQGVGTALLDQLIADVRVQDGLEQISLMCVSTNKIALHLYEKLGFKVYGTERSALKHVGQYFDESLMVLRL